MPASANPARGNFSKQDQYIANFCNRNPGANQCNNWQSNRRHWNNDQYQNFYHNHESDRDFNASRAASIFGITIEVATPQPNANNGYRDHVRACQSTYRSYDRQSDTYMGYDGRRHQCEF
jgi:hypothetical protein